jgi:hypothetical protein
MRPEATITGPAGPPGVIPISSLTSYRRATVAGRVHTVEIRPVERNYVLACVVTDTSGELTAPFYGRTHITGLGPGSNVRLRGPVGLSKAGPVMINPPTSYSTDRPVRRLLRFAGCRGVPSARAQCRPQTLRLRTEPEH